MTSATQVSGKLGWKASLDIILGGVLTPFSHHALPRLKHNHVTWEKIQNIDFQKGALFSLVQKVITWPLYIDVWQKPSQYSEVIILLLK